MSVITPEQIEHEINTLIASGWNEQDAVAIIAARYPDLEFTVTTTTVSEEFDSSDEWEDSGCYEDWDDSGC